MLKIASTGRIAHSFIPSRECMSRRDARAGVRTHGKGTGHFEAAFPMLSAKVAPIDEGWESNSEESSDSSSDDGDAEEDHDEPPEETPGDHTTPQPKATRTPLTLIWKQPARNTMRAVTELQKQEIADALRLKDATKLSELIEKLREIIAVAESRVAALSAEGKTGRHALPSCMFCSRRADQVCTSRRRSR